MPKDNHSYSSRGLPGLMVLDSIYLGVHLQLFKSYNWHLSEHPVPSGRDSLNLKIEADK